MVINLPFWLERKKGSKMQIQNFQKGASFSKKAD